MITRQELDDAVQKMCDFWKEAISEAGANEKQANAFALNMQKILRQEIGNRAGSTNPMLSVATGGNTGVSAILTDIMRDCDLRHLKSALPEHVATILNIQTGEVSVHTFKGMGTEEAEKPTKTILQEGRKLEGSISSKTGKEKV